MIQSQHAPRIGLGAVDDINHTENYERPHHTILIGPALLPVAPPLTESQILDKDPQLHFSLLRLQLVELIRLNHEDPTCALTFATAQLGPRAPPNPEFLHDLEETMSLLFFHPDQLPDKLKYLLEPALRRKVADEVNKAIVYHQSRRREAAIRQLVKMRAWAENTARESKVDLPDRIDLGIQGDSTEASEDRVHENGHEPMITT